MAAKTVFDKLNENFIEAPIVVGANVFTTVEYRDAVGLRDSQTLRRLKALEKDSKVRKVRTRREGRLVSAWEYIGK